MKRIYPLIAFLFISYFSFAQYENFDLSKFKLPEIKRHQLDFNYSFNNSIQRYNYEESQDRYYFDLSNDFEMNYSYYRNTSKIQSEGWGIFSSGMTLDREKREDYDKVKDDYYNFRINGGFLNRIYTKSDDRWFWTWSTSLYLSRALNREQDLWDYDNSLTEKYKLRSIYFRPRINIGGGFGRIEQISDARRAIYVIEDLYKKDKLNRLPEEAELIEIANKVAELRNQRFFDARLRHIYELESLDSLLNTMNLVSDNDIGFFTSLNDMWSYGHESRHSGTRLQATVSGQLYYRLYKEKTETYDYDYSKIIIKDDNNEYDEILRVNLELDSYKPIGLKWQRYLSVYLYAFRYFNDLGDYGTSNDNNNFNGNLSYGYNWYFNTRTSASFGVNGNYSRTDYDDDETNYYDRNNFHTGISGSLNYYFSPRLKASFQLSSNYNWYQNSDSSYNRQFRFFSSASLNYAIF
nr:hypothetical protein [uncultured Draconibacterium sp.]